MKFVKMLILLFTHQSLLIILLMILFSKTQQAKGVSMTYNNVKNTILFLNKFIRDINFKLWKVFQKPFLFASMIALQNDEKYFLFHLKSSSHCHDIQMFVLTF